MATKRKATAPHPVPRCSVCGFPEGPMSEWKGQAYCTVHTALIVDPERRKKR